MNAITCDELSSHLDLLAAGECDPPTDQAAMSHLQGCPTCAGQYAQSLQLLGMLDLNYSDSARRRLRQRLDTEALKMRRPVLLPFARRALAAAAMLLLAVGLGWMLQQGATPLAGSDLRLALLASEPRVPEPKMADVAAVRTKEGHVEMFKKAAAPSIVVMLEPGQIGEAFRRELDRARVAGKLPLPTGVPLTLTMHNAGTETLELRLGDQAANLDLDVQGKGVVRIPAAGVPDPDFLRPQLLKLAPGQQFTLRLDRLMAGSPNRVEYVYLTEPGDYELMARWRLRVAGTVATVRSEPLRVQVQVAGRGP